MSLEQAVWVLLFTAIVLANIPWIFGNRLFIFLSLPKQKTFIVGVIEWFVYFLIMGGLAFLLEHTAMGNIAPQEWEFYVVNLFLFMIFSFPGFIYRYNLKMYLDRREKLKVQN
ncbi:DUF2818 family protein [Thiomicrospira sp. R3]|uniref:DUF2818 family protein n=1 Tax=Thiomicrospira sp. R3 TaxID=3035472 RepID=UPI00259BBBF7|nr:DUF2818 family protein [Thiomicrospira sp. R3]WFE68087.1 DUF2818 family protein [Thiomicrospira sp. R3]